MERPLFAFVPTGSPYCVQTPRGFFRAHVGAPLPKEAVTNHRLVDDQEMSALIKDVLQRVEPRTILALLDADLAAGDLAAGDLAAGEEATYADLAYARIAVADLVVINKIDQVAPARAALDPAAHPHRVADLRAFTVEFV